MANQSWVQTLMSAQVAGGALASSTTATSILPSHARYQLPPNFFSIGSAVRVKASGSMTTLTTAGTYTFNINMSTANPPTVSVFTSQAITTNSAGVTGAWDLELLLVCRAVSSAANFITTGRAFGNVWLGSSVSGSSQGVAIMIPQTAPAVGGNFDATAANFVDLTATCSTNGAYSIQLQQYTLESMN